MMLRHMLPGWHCKSSLIWDRRLSHIHHILLINNFFFQESRHFLCQKTFCSKGEVETAIKDFLSSKTLKFYYTGINNLVNWWPKCIGVQGSYFDWLKQFQFIKSGKKVYSTIKHYFLIKYFFKYVYFSLFMYFLTK